MNEFIQMATSKFGIDESDAKGLTGGLLKMIEAEGPKGDVESLISKVPGASDLMDDAGAEAGGTKGMLGGMLSGAASALGGKAGTALGLADLVGKSGLKMDQLGDFVSSFTDFLKDKAGTDLVSRIMDGIPQLKKFLG